MRMSRLPVVALILGLFWLAAAPASAAAKTPKVAASIAPIHSLVSAVMGGVGTPDLLIEPDQSPHSFSLRPSQARGIAQADVIFWVGPGLEAPLSNALAAAPSARIVSLMDAPGLELLPARPAGLWSGMQDEEVHRHDLHDHEGHDHGDIDPHLWLDPQNAIAIVRHVAHVLSDIDQDNASLYTQNADKTVLELERLQADLQQQLAGVSDRSFFVMHDSLAYFAHRFHLAIGGTIIVSADHMPGADRLQKLRAELQSGRVVCLFTEPQLSDRWVDTLIAGTAARRAAIDPLGVDVGTGRYSYETMMRNLGKAVANCLQPA